MSKRRKKITIIVSVIVFVFVLIFLGFSYFLGNQIVAASTQLVTNEKTKDVHKKLWPEYGFDYDTFRQAYTIEKMELISSFDGHKIPADFMYSDSKNDDVVIMAHGLGGNRYTVYPIAAFFLENGYNVIAYDQRSSGENISEKTTFGYWEKYDLIDCITFAKDFTAGKKIGVWGESFGGATAVQAVAYEDVQQDIAFLVLDCPVSSMKWMVSEELKNMNMGIPLDYMMWCGSIMNRIELGFSYDDVDSAKIAKNIHTPALVINSSVDKTTPPFMGEDIYNSLSSTDKQLWTVTDSKHVGMWLDYNEEYRSKVLEFMK